MSHWLKLGEKYPPALDKMREIREATELKIRDKDRIRVKSHDFDDFVTLNRALQKDHLTAEFFVWLDRVDPEDAVRLYRSAQHALVKEGKYKICSKYVDPKDIEILCTYYKETLKRPSEFNEYRDKEFLEYGTCLIQVLATNGRKAEAQEAEAQEAAASLKKCVAGTEISARLSEAVDAALEKKPAS